MPRLHIPNIPLSLIAILALAIAVGTLSLELTSRGGNDEPTSSSGTGSRASEGFPEEFGRLFEIWDVLNQEHFQRDSWDPEILAEGAIRGLLGELDDPYAAYLSPQQYSLETQDFKGSFEGIGAQVAMKDGQITIIAPIPDTPADMSGVLPGDIILEIDGESTEGLGMQEAVIKIRGPKGDPVTLLVRRQAGGDPVTLTIFRDVIDVKSVVLQKLEGGIGHLRITNFGDTTFQEVVEALKELEDSNARGIILDLRNNPGGLLKTVVDVTGHFLDGGLVLYEKDSEDNRKDWNAKSGDSTDAIPVVVLVNEFSASGSEVLAGALMDRGRGTIIGVKTFGKGSVNTLRPLSDGSGIYFTVARWFTPNGTLIEGEGLEPEILVSQPEDGNEDRQMNVAIETLKTKIELSG